MKSARAGWRVQLGCMSVVAMLSTAFQLHQSGKATGFASEDPTQPEPQQVRFSLGFPREGRFFPPRGGLMEQSSRGRSDNTSSWAVRLKLVFMFKIANLCPACWPHCLLLSNSLFIFGLLLFVRSLQDAVSIVLILLAALCGLSACFLVAWLFIHHPLYLLIGLVVFTPLVISRRAVKVIHVCTGSLHV